MAKEFLKRKEHLKKIGSAKSDLGLKAEIGKEQNPLVGRSAAIAAINRGLKSLNPTPS